MTSLRSYRLTGSTGFRRKAATALALLALVAAAPLHAQGTLAAGAVTRVDLPTGRSFPITTAAPVTRVSIANPEVADVIVISERELVINAKASGESDALVWLANGQRQHFRVLVHSPADRMQIILSVKFAEVRKDLLFDIENSVRYRDDDVRAGQGIFRSDSPFDSLGNILLPNEGRFLTILSDFGTKNLLALLELEERRGRAKTLAEPNIVAANKEEADFLAGGELPIPVVQGGGENNSTRVSVEYREFGVKLNFLAEIISDSLVKLRVRPEVSNLDYANAVVISGFRIPALRTRRVESTLDVRQNESIVISGFYNTEDEKVRRGVPLLMDIPILGALFSSTTWQKNQTELVVVVTPVVYDPLRPRRQDVLQFKPDTTLPARDALERRLPEPARRP